MLNIKKYQTVTHIYMKSSNHFVFVGRRDASKSHQHELLYLNGILYMLYSKWQEKLRTMLVQNIISEITSTLTSFNEVQDKIAWKYTSRLRRLVYSIQDRNHSLKEYNLIQFKSLSILVRQHYVKFMCNT